MSKAKPKKKVSLKSRIEKIADEKTEEIMAGLPVKIEKIIEKAILSLLGLSNSYNENSIDHCNGRWNLFEDVLKAEAVKDCAKIVKEVKLKHNFDEFQAAFRSEYMKHFRYCMNYEAERKAKKLCEKYIDEEIKRLIPQKLEIDG